MEVNIDLVMRIDIYSHFFKVTKHNSRITALLFKFAFLYTQQNFQQKSGRSERVQGKTFATKTADNSEFRFHIGQLAPFKAMLKNQFIEPSMYEEVEHPLYEPETIPMKMKPNWVLRDRQPEAKAFILADEAQDFHTRLATIPTGGGKANPLSTKIKIPGGWTTMGDIELGDTITAWDGKPTKVLGVYPQGMRNVCKLTFTDDRTATCDLEHLWRVYLQEPTNPYSHGEWKVISTRELMTAMAYFKAYVPLIKPEQGSDEHVRGSAYLLGVTIHTKDYHVEEMEKYLNGSIQTREALLAGMMEIHGRVDQGNLAYDAPNMHLAGIVQYLVRSLGGIAKVNLQHHGSNNDTDEYFITYLVSISIDDADRFFKYHGHIYRTDDPFLALVDLKLGITNIELVGQEECQCIMIDHPDHLYVTDDFVVTHNTVVSLASAIEVQRRVLIVVLPKYAEKWASDVAGIADVKPNKDIMMIAGSSQVKGLVQLAADKKYIPSFIIVSLTTLQNFFKSYEENRFSEEFKEYGCSPEELCQTLGIGNIIVDEAHEQIYSVFKLMLYTHVPKVIALSGTMISGDPFIERIHTLMFPREIRFDKVKMKKYIRVYAVSYNFRNFQAANIKTTEFGSNNYSHMAFEKSILKRKDLTENYLLLIKYLVDMAYLKEYQKGDKLAVYAASIDMCTRINDYLKAKYPHLDVRRYVEKDPYANVIDADIRCTTILSAGTALDIPGLTTVIMTTNIKSIVSNQQTLGRLRETPGRTMRFLYIFSEQIQKQVDYHESKKEAFEDRVELIKEFRAPIAV